MELEWVQRPSNYFLPYTKRDRFIYWNDVCMAFVRGEFRSILEVVGARLKKGACAASEEENGRKFQQCRYSRFQELLNITCADAEIH